MIKSNGVAWMIPYKNDGYTLNAYDTEYVDLCASRGGSKCIATTEHG